MFNRRDTVIAVVLVLLLGGLWLIGGEDGDEPGAADAKPSSFLTSPSGARALYLTLEELGVPTARRLSPYAAGEVPSSGGLALLAPSQPPTPRELGVLGDWVASGGTLVYAARPGDPTLDTLGLALRSLRPDTLDPLAWTRWEGFAVKARTHRWTEGMSTTATVRYAFADSSRSLTGPDATPLLVTSRGGVAVAAFRRDEGTVVAWSDPTLLSNHSLREGARTLVFARVAAEATAEGDSLVFDEYHHGYRAGGGPVQATVRFVRETAPGHAAVQLALAGVGLLLLFGRRFGASVALEWERRRSPLEHVEALSAAYRRAGARRTVRRWLVAGLARRLGRSLPESASEAAFLERLAEHFPAAREDVDRLLAEWRRGRDADPGRLARAVDAVVSVVTAKPDERANPSEGRDG